MPNKLPSEVFWERAEQAELEELRKGRAEELILPWHKTVALFKGVEALLDYLDKHHKNCKCGEEE